MIRIRVSIEADGKISGYAVTGHSGTAAHGEDIVCAGVSALTQAALLGIGEYLHREIVYEVASGKLIMRLKDAPSAETEAILRTMLLGLLEMEKSYPKAVRIEKEQRR